MVGSIEIASKGRNVEKDPHEKEIQLEERHNDRTVS